MNLRRNISRKSSVYGHGRTPDIRERGENTLRQGLAALPALLRWKPALTGAVEAKLAALDLSKYRDSMRPLIEKDIAALQEIL